MARMNARYPGSCSICGQSFRAGAEIDGGNPDTVPKLKAELAEARQAAGIEEPLT